MQNVITRGTTPTFSFTLPFEAAQVKKIFITFRQSDKNVLEKNLNDCTTEDYCISVTLSQEDTLLLQENKNVFLQVRLEDKEKSAFASPVFRLCVLPVLKGGILV